MKPGVRAIPAARLCVSPPENETQYRPGLRLQLRQEATNDDLESNGDRDRRACPWHCRCGLRRKLELERRARKRDERIRRRSWRLRLWRRRRRLVVERFGGDVEGCDLAARHDSRRSGRQDAV